MGALRHRLGDHYSRIRLLYCVQAPLVPARYFWGSVIGGATGAPQGEPPHSCLVRGRERVYVTFSPGQEVRPDPGWRTESFAACWLGDSQAVIAVSEMGAPSLPAAAVPCQNAPPPDPAYYVDYSGPWGHRMAGPFG